MIETHLLKLRSRHRIGADEERAIRSMVGTSRIVRRDQVVVKAGQGLDESLLLVEGWMARAKDLRDGQRQVSELHVSGDFVDLHGFALKSLDHNLIALTECRIGVVPHARLEQLVSAFPRLQRIYWFATNLDAATHREWALSLGRRTALSRLAHLFCELRIRLEMVGRVADDSYEFPLTQEDLAECLGLTAVHVNRSLQELRARGLIRVAGRRVEILKRRELEDVAEFDPTYLYLQGTPI